MTERPMQDGCGRCGNGEGGTDRREFVSASLLAAAALLLGGCGSEAAPAAPETPPQSTAFTVQLSAHPELATVGGAVLINGPRSTPIALVRTAEGYLAMSRVCPHQGNIIGRNGAGFRCPAHGATFDINGTWVGGQPTGNMARLTVQHDAARGTLTIA